MRYLDFISIWHLRRFVYQPRFIQPFPSLFPQDSSVKIQLIVKYLTSVFLVSLLLSLSHILSISIVIASEIKNIALSMHLVTLYLRLVGYR